VTTVEDEWLWGWDPTPGIVSVFAEPDGRAYVWRRTETTQLIREEARFRPWLLLANLEDLEHLGAHLRPEVGEPMAQQTVVYEELSGNGGLRFRVRATDLRVLVGAVLRGARQRIGRHIRHINDLPNTRVLCLPPEEQYLVDTGRTYFRDLDWASVRRLQFDLETTGLDPARHRIFLVALRSPEGKIQIYETRSLDDAGESALIRELLAAIQAHDPDVIENHNLHGFDLPFLVERARRLHVPLTLGRYGPPGLRLRAAATGRGIRLDWGDGGDASPADRPRRMRYTTPGREFIDTLDAVRRQDFVARDLPDHGLKTVARKLGLASDQREYIPGADVYDTYQRDPSRVRRYAGQDVIEAAAVADVLGGAAFALARMAPRRYERLADAGPATGVLDPLIVRAYLRANSALPTHQQGDGTIHNGAALHLFATGVAQRIVKADVASLYPSLMRQFRIGPKRDRLGVMLALVDRLVEQRLRAKRLAKELPRNTAERFAQEALSAAMKIVINSAYGYLGASGLTRFADVHAANEVTRHGREVLATICRELARRNMVLLEADTDGVYFSVPVHFTESDEQRVVAEVAAVLPERVQLEFEGRYAAMLSHEPKNYALLPYDGAVILRGVAFRSSRAEPFGETFLALATERILRGDVQGVRRAYVECCTALRRRAVPTAMLTMSTRLTKTPEQYFSVRTSRRELVYEALIQSGRTDWQPGERVRVYRAVGGRPALLRISPMDFMVQRETHPLDDSFRERQRDTRSPNPSAPESDPRDYDIEYYVTTLRQNFASRLQRALTPEDFELTFADPRQESLFAALLVDAKPILTLLKKPS
jgi:DNA polymerase elongation subunit (family B)